MSNDHLTYFKIENFKKFASLEVKDIGQFNLIVGDNNVGKTCLLEALLVDENNKQLISNFYIALTKRGFKFQIEEITRKIGNLSETQTLYPKDNYFEQYIIGKFSEELNFQYKTIKKATHFNINIPKEDLVLKLVRANNTNDTQDFETVSINNQLKIPIKDYVKQYINIDKEIKNPKDFMIYWIYGYNEHILNFPLIGFNATPLESEAKNIYENIKTKKEKEILIDTLKVIDSKIEDVELRENFEDLKSVFLFSFEDQNAFIPLNFLGDGFKRIFYIVLKTISLREKRIMIDEIEIGIHYSKQKDFWKNILNVFKVLDVQLFATTHSDDCKKAYIEASEEMQFENKIRLIELKEDKEDKQIYASTYTFKQIQTGINSNLKMLG